MIYIKFNEFSRRLAMIDNPKASLWFKLPQNTLMVYSLNVQDAITGKLIFEKSGTNKWGEFDNNETDFRFNPKETDTNYAFISFKLTAYFNGTDEESGIPMEGMEVETSIPQSMKETEEYVTISQFNQYYKDLHGSISSIVGIQVPRDLGEHRAPDRLPIAITEGMDYGYLLYNLIQLNQEAENDGKDFIYNIDIYPTRLAAKYIKLDLNISKIQDSASIIKDKIKMLQLDLAAAQKSTAGYTILNRSSGEPVDDLENSLLDGWVGNPDDIRDGLLQLDEGKGNINKEVFNNIIDIYSTLNDSKIISASQLTKYKYFTYIKSNIDKLMRLVYSEWLDRQEARRLEQEEKEK